MWTPFFTFSYSFDGGMGRICPDRNQVLVHQKERLNLAKDQKKYDMCRNWKWTTCWFYLRIHVEEHKGVFCFFLNIYIGIIWSQETNAIHTWKRREYYYRNQEQKLILVVSEPKTWEMDKTPCGVDLGLKDNDIDVGYDIDDECDDDKHLINVYLLALY